MYIALGVIVLVALYLVFIYNGLVRARQMAEEAWSGIDVQLKRRADLIPNLIETVKGYAAHEKSTLEEVVELRNKAQAVPSGDVAGRAQAEGLLGQALGRVIALAEAYPDLKANENFKQLQMELGDLENKIAAARRFFNNAVSEYNTKRQAFPAVLFANALGFGPQDFFNLDETERAATATPPKVQF
jgi:LemA protein